MAGEKAAFGAGSQGERIGLELRRSIESLEAGRGSGSIAGARSLEPTKRPSSTSSTTTTFSSTTASRSSADDGRQASARLLRLRKRLDEALTHTSIGGAGLRPHLLLALATVALGARSMTNPVALGMLVCLAVLYVGQMELEQREQMRQEASFAERNALFLEEGRPLVAEPVLWLNALVASGWRTSIRPYLEMTIFEEIVAQFEELSPYLPKSLRAVQLLDLGLGPQPPHIRSLAAVSAPFDGHDGGVLQAELEWEGPDASATLAFRLANVQSQPRLRLRRARLRAAVRLHFEWLDQEPYVGRVRFSFARSPDISEFALEPIGSLDVTTLPGIGPSIRDALRTSLLDLYVLPKFKETDMREPTRKQKAAMMAAATASMSAPHAGTVDAHGGQANAAAAAAAFAQAASFSPSTVTSAAQKSSVAATSRSTAASLSAWATVAAVWSARASDEWTAVQRPWLSLHPQCYRS